MFHWFRPAEVLRSFLTLLDERPEVHVVYLTLGIERDKRIQELVNRLDAHERGHVIDRFLTTDEMRLIWSITDALVSVPVQDGISEGILEGMYAGCIPIVSDLASNRSFLEDGVSGVFVRGDADSARDLAATFESVVDDLPELKSRMVERNRRWVSDEASVESTAIEVVKMVQQLAERK